MQQMFFCYTGAKAADKNWFILASDSRARSILKSYNFDGKGLKIPNLNTFRDLGAHLNFNRNSNGVTIIQRFNKATAMARRIKWMPLTRQDKEKLVQTNILPAALYGVESSNGSKQALENLRSSIASAIGSRSDRRNVNLTYDTAQAGKDLDPVVNILYRRVAELRRCMAKHTGKKC